MVDIEVEKGTAMQGLYSPSERGRQLYAIGLQIKKKNEKWKGITNVYHTKS